MGLYVSTTGTNVAIYDLGVFLTHPTVDYDCAQFTSNRVKNSDDLTLAILTGALQWRKAPGGPVQAPTSYDRDYLEINQENTGSGEPLDRSVTFGDLTGFTQYWKKILLPVLPALTTTSVLTIPLLNFTSFKMYIEFSNTAQTKFKALEMRAFKTASNSVSDTIYSVISNSLNVLVNLDVVGSDAILSFTNNENFVLQASITHLT